jgi:hypothetical protein
MDLTNQAAQPASQATSFRESIRQQLVRIDWRDIVILIRVDAILTVGTIYLFKHADPVVFGSWATFATTMAGLYHWLVVRDSKQPDAGA